MRHPLDKRTALWTRARRRIDRYEHALFGNGVFVFFAFGLVIAIWALELIMTARHGQGWIATLHLAAIGPIWIMVTSLTAYALLRRLTGAARKRATMDE